MTDLQNAQYTLSTLFLDISIWSPSQLALQQERIKEKIFSALSQIDNARRVYEADQITGQDPDIQVSEAADVI